MLEKEEDTLPAVIFLTRTQRNQGKRRWTTYLTYEVVMMLPVLNCPVSKHQKKLRRKKNPDAVFINQKIDKTLTLRRQDVGINKPPVSQILINMILTACNSKHLIKWTKSFLQEAGEYEDLLTSVKRRKIKWYGYVTRANNLSKTILQGIVIGEKVGWQHDREDRENLWLYRVWHMTEISGRNWSIVHELNDHNRSWDWWWWWWGKCFN